MRKVLVAYIILLFSGCESQIETNTDITLNDLDIELQSIPINSSTQSNTTNVTVQVNATINVEINMTTKEKIESPQEETKSQEEAIKEENPEEKYCLELGCGEGTIVVGSINSNKWHYCNCRYASTIYEENLLCFSSIEQAESEGYVQAKVC